MKKDQGEVRVDLKAEIEKRLKYLSDWLDFADERLNEGSKLVSDPYYVGYWEAQQKRYSEEIQFLINLLKHEAFQTTEPL